MNISATDEETSIDLKHLEPQVRLSIARADEALTKVLSEAQTALCAPAENSTERVWDAKLKKP